MNALEELRRWQQRYVGIGSSYSELVGIADRFEREWLECPKDEDGVPIRIGDTLYCGERRIDVYALGFDYVVDDNFGDYDPSNWSHVQPDSWERLIEDADKDACDYFDACDTKCSECGIGPECDKAKARDIVRRCKKLAGVEVAG